MDELRRVSRPQVIFTWDPAVLAERMWLVAENLPEIAAHESRLATLRDLLDHVGPARIVALPVPADCRDGVIGAYWRRPAAFLDPSVRAAASGIALLDPDAVERATQCLAQDLRNGAWHARHRDLRALEELDLGYRLVVVDSRGNTQRPVRPTGTEGPAPTGGNGRVGGDHHVPPATPATRSRPYTCRPETEARRCHQRPCNRRAPGRAIRFAGCGPEISATADPPEAVEAGPLLLRRGRVEDAQALAATIAGSLELLMGWVSWASPRTATRAAQTARLSSLGWGPADDDY